MATIKLKFHPSARLITLSPLYRKNFLSHYSHLLYFILVALFFLRSDGSATSRLIDTVDSLKRYKILGKK